MEGGGSRVTGCLWLNEGCTAGQVVEYRVDSTAYSTADHSMACMHTDNTADNKTACRFERMVERMVECMVEHMAERMVERMVGCLTERMVDILVGVLQALPPQ